MHVQGNLSKLQVQLDDPVRYFLPIDETRLDLNACLGRPIRLTYSGIINCIHCTREIKKSFNQGYCFPCFRRLARCDICYVRPEKCHYRAGTCREPQWGEANCMQAHVVYLSNTSALKVGITRRSQIPVRWIDQGAVQALPIFEVDERYHSGRIETLFKAHISDRTDWRRMLKAQAELIDLLAHRDNLKARIGAELSRLRNELGEHAIRSLNNVETVSIAYPVERYPKTVKALNLDKTPSITGILMGIKGQYLILDTGVLNVRKFAGYRVTFET